MTIAGFAEQLWPLALGLDGLYADWLPRLRAMFGPWRRPRDQDPAGEPDGYGGLARRGSWERLLGSEWAVADAVPDEFLRRAAMREQLFLQLSRVAPSAAPRTRVWFDCGPTQLGAPRLAHLAILVVLQRRAREVGGELVWSVLHDPTRTWDTVDPQALLAQRTTRSERPTLQGDGERLVVGARCDGAHSIEVVEEDGALRVTHAGRSVRLDLPEPVRTAHWLSAPVRREPRAPAPTADGVNAIAFVHGGTALLVRDGERVFAYAVPDRPRVHTKLRGADPRDDGSLVAAGWHRQHLTTLRRVGDEAVLFLGNRRLRMPWPAGMEPDEGLPWLAALPRAYMGPDPGERIGCLVRDARGVVFALDFLRGESQALGRACSQVFCIGGVYTWIGTDRQVRLTPSGRDRNTMHLLHDYGWAESPTVPDDGQVYTVQEGRPLRAVRQGASVWVSRVVVRGRPPSPTELRTDQTLVGPLQDQRGPIRLLARTEHELLQIPGGRVLATFERRIEHVALGGARRGRIAVAIEGVIQFLGADGSELLTFAPGELT